MIRDTAHAQKAAAGEKQARIDRRRGRWSIHGPGNGKMTARTAVEQLRRDYGSGGGRGRDAERQPGRQTAGARRRKDVITGWLRGVIQLAAAEVARRKEAAAGFDLGSHCGFGRLGRGGTAIGCG